MPDDRYVLEGEIGRGFFGVVHRARQVHLDRVCALKLIRVRTNPVDVLERMSRVPWNLGGGPVMFRLLRLQYRGWV